MFTQNIYIYILCFTYVTYVCEAIYDFLYGSIDIYI